MGQGASAAAHVGTQQNVMQAADETEFDQEDEDAVLGTSLTLQKCNFTYMFPQNQGKFVFSTCSALHLLNSPFCN